MLRKVESYCFGCDTFQKPERECKEGSLELLVGNEPLTCPLCKEKKLSPITLAMSLSLLVRLHKRIRKLEKEYG